MAEETNTKKKKTSKKATTKPKETKPKTTKKETPKKQNSVQNKKVETTKKKETSKKILESTTLPPNIDKTIIFNKEETKNIKEVMKTIEKKTATIQQKEERTQKILMIILVSLLITTILLGTIYVVIGIKNEKEASKISATENESNTINSNVYKKVLENTKNIDLGENIPNEEESEYSTIIPLTIKEFESKILSKENMIVLISKKSCFYCLTFEETIHKVLSAQDKKIYKLDIFNMEEEEIERLREYYRFTMTPTVFKIEDGIVTSDLIEAQTEEKFANWIEENR